MTLGGSCKASVAGGFRYDERRSQQTIAIWSSENDLTVSNNEKRLSSLKVNTKLVSSEERAFEKFAEVFLVTNFPKALILFFNWNWGIKSNYSNFFVSQSEASVERIVGQLIQPKSNLPRVGWKEKS